MIIDRLTDRFPPSWAAPSPQVHLHGPGQGDVQGLPLGALRLLLPQRLPLVPPHRRPLRRQDVRGLVPPCLVRCSALSPARRSIGSDASTPDASQHSLLFIVIPWTHRVIAGGKPAAKGGKAPAKKAADDDDDVDLFGDDDVSPEF